MLPSANKSQIYIDAPEGTDLDQNYKITQTILDFVATDKETASIQSFVGKPPVLDFNGLYKGSHLKNVFNLATLRVNLTPINNRNISSSQIVKKMRKTINNSDIIKKYQAEGLTILFIKDPPGPPFQATLVAKIKGPDSQIREKISSNIEKQFRETTGVVDIDNSVQEPYFRTILEIDYRKAFLSAVTTADVAYAIRTVHAKQYHIPDHNELSYIELQYPRQIRNTAQNLESI